MKKLAFSLSSALLLLSVVFFAPSETRAADCNPSVQEVQDYPVKITTDVYFRKTIQGAPEDNCPISEVIGSFSNGQVVWVVGQVETGVVINKDTNEYGSWLYIEHPKTKEYGFVWSAYALKTDIPVGQENRQEVLIEKSASPTPTVEQKECEVISDVTDYFVKVTEGMNVRNGVCNGKIINSLGSGEVVKVIGKIDLWLYIEIPGGGKGFIHSDYTQVTPAPVGRENEVEVLIGSDDKAVVGQEPVVAPETGGTLKDIVGHPYETAIRYLEKSKIVEGYPDGLFKADILINRAEFTKLVVGAKLKAEPFSSAADCFPDVSKTAWYASYVCYAKDSGIISGFPDKTFKPGDNIKVVEAAKILANTFDLAMDPETGVWYEAYVKAMQENNYIPTTLKKLDQSVNRGELAEMLWRVLEKVNNKASSQFDFKTNQTTSPVPENSDLAVCTDKQLPSSIDMKKIRAAWLEWNNKARQQQGSGVLVMHEGLNYSSSVWAQQNKQDGAISHVRKDQTVSDWFKALGISFKQVTGFVYAENIGVQSYTCDQPDCTDEAMAVAKTIFDAFMKEEGSASTKHYDNIMQPDFKQLGLGLAVDQVAKKLYLTTHYAQAVETYPNTCK